MSRPGAYLRQLRESRGWDQAELAQRADISRATISSHENGHTTPSLKQRRRYATAFGYDHVDDFDAGWRADVVPQQQPAPGEMPGIPVLSEVPAGPGDVDPSDMGLDNGVASYRIPPQLVGIDDPTAFGLTVQGDSMTPTYHPGDMVICSPRAPHEDGMVAALRLDDGQCTLKRIYALPDDRIELRPDNTRLPPKIVHREQITRMARVVTHIQKLFTPGPAPGRSTPGTAPTAPRFSGSSGAAHSDDLTSDPTPADHAHTPTSHDTDAAERARIEAWLSKQRHRQP